MNIWEAETGLTSYTMKEKEIIISPWTLRSAVTSAGPRHHPCLSNATKLLSTAGVIKYGRPGYQIT
jgi:hypothetical protein